MIELAPPPVPLVPWYDGHLEWEDYVWLWLAHERAPSGRETRAVRDQEIIDSEKAADLAMEQDQYPCAGKGSLCRQCFAKEVYEVVHTRADDEICLDCHACGYSQPTGRHFRVVPPCSVALYHKVRDSRLRPTFRTHRGRSRAARCAAPRVRGSRRTAARTTLNTGPPGADDGGGEPEPPSRWSTTGADERTERTKTPRRERRSVWDVGGTSRRVAEPTNDESPRGATLAGIPYRAGERGVTAGQAPRILADSRPATQTHARATEAASGGYSDACTY